MIEVRKPWKHEGFGCAKEGPLTQAWVGITMMKIDQLEPIDLESEEFKEAITSQQVHHFAQWAEISTAAEEAKARMSGFVPHAEIRLENILTHAEPPVSPKIEVVPGYGFGRLLGSFLPRKFREQVVEALLAEAMQDYYEACEAGDEARIKRLRYMVPVWLFCSVFAGAISTIFGALKASAGISKD
ncbi:hypothetical protein EH244_29905 [Variovorax beijingensis]|uniref:Uncharacterized protein n=1 Tax=Variovorax beijingensis TaxID=2496117 RepID=A0A3P3E2U9_9BURK|nr:hypothetical protein [Variovorax beijingensis]RRH80807.1 hypothetical protein EH244_29905 [Variovorax beijingensis]